jgi:hypothetical protein
MGRRWCGAAQIADINTATQFNGAQSLQQPIKSRFSVYGAAVAISNGCGQLNDALRLFLRSFEVTRNSREGLETIGEIRPFELGEVTRSLLSAGETQRRCDALVSIYSRGERHWVLDDRWGVCEIDLLRHRWRSWVLPHASLDAVQLVESAVMQPLAQLLRPRGVELVPAVSLERGGWAALVIAPYPITAEVSGAIRAGYRVVGQRWTALLRKSDRIVLRHVPGVMEVPRGAGGKWIGKSIEWTDVTTGNPWATAETAWCDAVVTIGAGRRSRSCGRIVPAHEARGLLRRARSISALPVDWGCLQHCAAALAERCMCMQVELSRHEEEFLQLLEILRKRAAQKVEVSVFGTTQARRQARINRAAGALTGGLPVLENFRR